MSERNQSMIGGVIPVEPVIETGEQVHEEPVAETAPEDLGYDATPKPDPNWPAWGEQVLEAEGVEDPAEGILGQDSEVRIEALLQARLILGEQKGVMGMVSQPNLVDLIDLADYILSGEKPR